MLDSDWKVLFQVGRVGSVFVEINTNSAQLELGLWLSFAIIYRDYSGKAYRSSHREVRLGDWGSEGPKARH